MNENPTEPATPHTDPKVRTYRVTFVAKIVLAHRTRRRHKLISPWHREMQQRKYARALAVVR